MTDLSYEEAEKMLAERIHEFPIMEKFILDEKPEESIKVILSIEHIDGALLPIVVVEVKLVLGFYTPLRLLATKLHSTTDIPLEASERIAIMIESLIPEQILGELLAFEEYWFSELGDTGNIPEADKNLKEKLELRPQEGAGQPTAEEKKHAGGVHPLTREEVLRSIAPSRTMAKDIASVTAKSTPQAPTPTQKPAAPTSVAGPSAGNEAK